MQSLDESVVRQDRAKLHALNYMGKISEDEKSSCHLIQGSLGYNYQIILPFTQDPMTSQCTCTDFRIRQKPCKHIYFTLSYLQQQINGQNIISLTHSSSSSLPRTLCEYCYTPITHLIHVTFPFSCYLAIHGACLSKNLQIGTQSKLL